MKLAFDRSVRRYDQDGRLRIEISPITKATVNPYYGREIPDYEGLGLDPAKVYYLLRDPQELQRAISTFNNIPLLIKHQPVSANDHPKELVVGTTGSHARWNDPYIEVDLTIWDAAAIAGIESKEQTELSSAYRYQADMTAGEYQGMRYDGVMRNIKGNHVALVDVGRAGHDVIVQDQNPFTETNLMGKESSIAQAAAKAKQALQDKLSKGVDHIDELDDILIQLVQDVLKTSASEPEDDVATDEDEAEIENAKLSHSEQEQYPASEQAIPAKPQEKLAEDRAVRRIEALYQARDEVKSLVGKVAFDSAEAVYKFALDQQGISTHGVHPSAYRAMVHMLLQQKNGSAVHMANDANSVLSIQKQFPHLGRIKQG